jgi:hypothetical protein
MSRFSTNGGSVQLKVSQFKVICRAMSIRPLLAILIALAMLFAPIAGGSGEVMAMPPAADHHAQVVEGGHCGEQPAKSDDGKTDEMSCCIAMCTAVALAPVEPIGPQAMASAVDQPSLVQPVHGFLAELPTPPPRLA